MARSTVMSRCEEDGHCSTCTSLQLLITKNFNIYQQLVLTRTLNEANLEMRNQVNTMTSMKKVIKIAQVTVLNAKTG